MRALIQTCGMAVCLLAAASCDDDDKTGNLSGQDRDFIMKASYINLGEVDAGHIARERGLSGAIRDYGNRMVTDHGAAQVELKGIAERNDMTAPSETDEEHREMAAMLMMLEGRAFDSTYIYLMVSGHDKAIMLHEQQHSRGDDENVRQYAAQKLPVIEHHRHMADSLARTLFPR